MHSICIDTAYDRCKDNDKPNDDDNWKKKLRKVFFCNYLMKASLNQKLHSKGPVACSNRGG